LWGLSSAVLVRRFHILCFAFLSHLPFGTANGELLRVARDFVEKLLCSEATFSQLAEKNLVEDNGDRKTGMLFRCIQTIADEMSMSRRIICSWLSILRRHQ